MYILSFFFNSACLLVHLTSLSNIASPNKSSKRSRAEEFSGNVAEDFVMDKNQVNEHLKSEL